MYTHNHRPGSGRQGKDLDWIGDAAQVMEAQRQQRLDADFLEIGRGQHRHLEFLGQALQPRRAVDGGADDREVEPVLGADIAEGHGTDMQADADPMSEYLTHVSQVREGAVGDMGFTLEDFRRYIDALRKAKQLKP